MWAVLDGRMRSTGLFLGSKFLALRYLLKAAVGRYLFKESQARADGVAEAEPWGRTRLLRVSPSGP